jgi:hypothetical protein
VGSVYGNLNFSNLLYGSYALLRTIFTYPGLGLDNSSAFFLAKASSYEIISFVFLFILALGIFITPLIMAFARRKNLFGHYRIPIIFLIPWTICNIGFAFYWTPKDIQFWMPVAISWWILAGLILQLILSNPLVILRKSFFFSKAILASVMLVFIALLVGINGIGLIVPHHFLESNSYYWIAMSVKNNARPEDMILLFDDDRYIGYFSKRYAVSIFEELLKENLQKQVVFENIDKVVSEVQQIGGKVYIAGSSTDPDFRWDALNSVGLYIEDFDHFKTKPAWKTQDKEFLEVLNP